MRTAGVRPEHGFAFGPAHMAYIVEALRNRERGDTNRVFWLSDAVEIRQEATPKPGDLLCLNRGNRRHTYASLRRDYWLNGNHNRVPRDISHTALVVDTVEEQGRRFVVTIGGNERNSVRQARIALNPSRGILNPAAHRIFGMIKIISC